MVVPQANLYLQGSIPTKRRSILVGAAASAAGGFFPRAALAADSKAANPAPADLAAALDGFRASIPAHFDRTYVENVVVPFFLTSVCEGERPALPMIDVTLSKENALPRVSRCSSRAGEAR